jgi:cellulose synthase/poly-beta-1,6-N-acetylglucosamine synthase-like glycosyltransferase
MLNSRERTNKRVSELFSTTPDTSWRRSLRVTNSSTRFGSKSDFSGEVSRENRARKGCTKLIQCRILSEIQFQSFSLELNPPFIYFKNYADFVVIDIVIYIFDTTSFISLPTSIMLIVYHSKHFFRIISSSILLSFSYECILRLRNRINGTKNINCIEVFAISQEQFCTS